jgi:cystathionine beta-synthase
MLRRAEEDGLKPGGTIVEATSGNTGASLALLAAVRGYKCIFVMPDKMSQEKIATCARSAPGRRLPHGGRADDPRSYYKVSRASPTRRRTLLREPVPQPREPRSALPLERRPRSGADGGDFDAFVAGMGTGGTISGTGKFFKEKKARHPDRRRRSGRLALLRLRQDRRITKPFSYKVEGIGEDFFPTTMNLKIIDDIVRVDDKECFLMTRDLTRLEGLFVGGSGGAAVAGAIKYAASDRQEDEDPRLPGRRRVTSTSPRSSTTTGCARTASSRTSRASARCATSSPQGPRDRDGDAGVEGARGHRRR